MWNKSLASSSLKLSSPEMYSSNLFELCVKLWVWAWGLHILPVPVWVLCRYCGSSFVSSDQRMASSLHNLFPGCPWHASLWLESVSSAKVMFLLVWILTVHSCTGGVNISYNHLLFCEHQEFFFSSMNCFSFLFGMMLSHVTAEDNPLVLTWFYKLWELKSEITSLHSSGLCLWVCYDKCVVDSVLKLVFDCTYTELLHLVTTSHHLHVHTHTHTHTERAVS